MRRECLLPCGCGRETGVRRDYLSEEIEVGGVEAGVNVDALAGLALARPAIFDAGEPLEIEVDGTFGAFALAQHFCVEDGDREK